MIRVGEKLKEERIRLGYTIEEVAKATKIRPSFISAIEKGEYHSLPGGSYAHGFVKNYIEFVGLPVKEYLALFRREFDEKEFLKVLPESFVEKEKIPVKTLRINRTIGLSLAIFLFIIFYVLYQYRAAFFSPSLLISQPSQNARIATQEVLVSGITDTNTIVTVNNLPSYVDGSGHFSKQIPVFPGNTTIVVKAVNEFGKTTEIDRNVVILVNQ